MPYGLHRAGSPFTLFVMYKMMLTQYGIKGGGGEYGLEKTQGSSRGLILNNVSTNVRWDCGKPRNP
jgi:hypothetical protein